MKQFWVLFKANLLMQIRNKQVVFWSLVFPILLMLLFGTLFSSQGFTQQSGGKKVDLNFASYLVPGLIVLAVMSTGLIGYASTLAVYREKGIFRRIRTTPLPISTFILSKVLVQTLQVVIQAVILTVVGVVVFKAELDWGNLGLGILEVVLIGLTFVAIGQMIAAVVKRSETVSLVTQMINTPMMLLGGLIIPLSQFGDVPILPQIGSFLPTGIAVNILRPTISPEPFKNISDIQGILLLPVWASLLILVGYLVVSTIIANRFFKWEI